MVGRVWPSLLLCALAVACAGEPRSEPIVLRYSGSAVGAEGAVLARQLERFAATRPDIRVVVEPAPDSADQRHQLYVQWLAARSNTPDVLQLDVIWTPEMASAGWLLELDRFAPDTHGFFSQTIAANRLDGRLYALPLFVDAGMLYWRTDLVDAPPATFDELVDAARAAQREHDIRYGFVWQGKRYEGLVTVFLEHLGGFGGVIVDDDGAVAIDSEAAVDALTFMRDSVHALGVVPEQALAWQEEDARFAFQNGNAVFMRNWPYAYPLMQDAAQSIVAGNFAVAPMPVGDGGRPTAALGGAQLAINAHSEHPEAAYALVAFLTAPEQMLERAALAGQYPARPAVYDEPTLGAALPIPPADARRVIERATPRPVSPVYAELSAALQIELHAALTDQVSPGTAIANAAHELDRVLAAAREPPPSPGPVQTALVVLAALLAIGAAVWAASWATGGARSRTSDAVSHARGGWWLVAPAAVIVAVVAVFPLVWTFWESVHAHDLRTPARGSAFVGFANYSEAIASARFWAALAHTAAFTAITVALELAFGTAVAVALNGVGRGRGLARAVALLPWAVPTVVAALVWRFLFSDAGFMSAALGRSAWFSDPVWAWLPLILADVWKTTPFVALLLLAALQSIDPTLYEAARADGASAWQRFRYITLPLLRPALLVALLFRTLDAFRVFDLTYVLTGGGPGTATEPIALYTFSTLLQHLRFGYGSALSVVAFAVAFALALGYVRWLGSDPTEGAT